MTEKPDADIFRRRLAVLRRARLGARRWWPHYLFHFADLSNVISILDSGELLSRGLVQSENLDFSDSASPDVIDQTDQRWKDYVRFYFRPKTPTLYRNEGFRPVNRRPLGGAHCPSPVYLLFDLESVICRANSLFSFGSLARAGVEVYASAAHFEQLPFDLVYHDSRFAKEERDDIIFHRHAEVIVPDRIDLNSLRWILCRSTAEFETLRTLLPAEVWAQLGDKIGTRTDFNLFNREWVYVNRVVLSGEHAIFYFNPARSLMDAGPFDLCVEVEQGGKTFTWRQKDVEITAPLDVDLSVLRPSERYRICLSIDDKIAYTGWYNSENNPF
jgi:hypothetical protein